MIEISRSLARQLRAVLKKSRPRNLTQNAHPVTTFLADKDGLRVQTIQGDVAIECGQPGSYKPDRIIMATEALADFEGRKNEIVTLAATDDRVQARWFDGAVPQSKEYAVPDTSKLPDFPDYPSEWSDPGQGFLKALAAAYPCVSREAVRFALTHLQLRGSRGEIHATDGRQALIQAGFTFPFTEDVLVPALPVFGSADLPADERIAIARTDTRFGIRIGPWTFLLVIDRQSRYPDVAGILPSSRKAGTTWTVPPNDGAFLAKTLPRLPGKEDDDSPITIDLNGHAAIRVRPEGEERATEVVLTNSEIAGTPVRFRSNRCYVERAVALGMSQFKIVDADTPIVAGDDKRTFVWMPLDKGRCVPPSEDALRITADAASPTQTNQERRTKVKKTPQTDPTPREAPPTSERNTMPKLNGIGALIEESQALKQILRDAFHRVQRLGAGLKRHRQHSKTFAAAITSLKQLQHIDA